MGFEDYIGEVIATIMALIFGGKFAVGKHKQYKENKKKAAKFKIPKKLLSAIEEIPVILQRLDVLEGDVDKGDGHLKNELEKVEMDIRQDVKELSTKMSDRFSKVYETINGMKEDIGDIRSSMAELVGTAKAILNINKGEMG